MSNATVKLTGSSAFQDIGTISTSTSGLAGNMQSVNQILDVGLRNTPNIKDSFLRVSDLTGLGLATLNGNQLTVADLTSSSSISVNGTSGVNALVFSGATVSVSGGVATITITGSGGGTGTVTSVGITSTTLTVSGTVTTSGDLTVNLSSTQVSDLALAATALQPVTGLAGSYTNTNLTINSSGQITAAANGTGGTGSTSPYNVTPDMHPAIPTGVGLGPNDEFEYGSTVDTAGARYSGATSWTLQNSSGTTYEVITGAVIIQGHTGSVNNESAITQPIATPSAAFRYRCKMLSMPGVSGNAFAGIFIGVGSTGAGYMFGAYNGNTGTAYVILNSSYTTFSSVITTQAFFSNSGIELQAQNLYWDIQYDGTNLTFAISGDGVQFFVVYTTASPSAFDSIGLFCGAANTNTWIPSSPNVAFDWFRRIS